MKQRWGLDRNVLRPTPGDPWGVEQHHWNTGAKENQQLNPGGFNVSRIFIVFYAYYACFSDIMSCSRWAVQHFTLFMGLSLFTMCYKAIFKVIYFINISRWREDYTPWNSVILSANKILLIIWIPLWDSIKFIQHLYHHTRHMWQKSKGLSVRILRVMPHRNFKKLRVRWLYYDRY